MKYYLLLTCLISSLILPAQKVMKKQQLFWQNAEHQFENRFSKQGLPNLNFHPTFNLSRELITKKLSKSSKGISIFCAISGSEATAFGEVNYKGNKISLSNSTVTSVKKNKYSSSQLPKILSYTESFATNKASATQALKSLTVKGMAEADVALGEFMVFDQVLDKERKEKIESYLSMKYGISLDLSKDYIDGEGKKIWQTKQNNNFTKNATFIGRDDDTGLFQKQSGNIASDENLVIALNHKYDLNSDNPTSLEDKEFLIWSESEATLDLSTSQISEPNKLWRVQCLGEGIRNTPFYFEIDLNQILKERSIMAHEVLCLVLDDKSVKGIDIKNSVYYPMIIKQDKAYVSNVMLDQNKSGMDHFSFMIKSNPQKKKPEMLLFPNPVLTNQLFEIKFSNDDEYDIKIYDIKGSLIISDKANNYYNNKLSISGMYLVSIEKEGNIVTTFNLSVN